MPSNLEINITVKRDGKVLGGFPLYRRLQVDEVQQFSTEQATGGGYASLPISLLDTLQALILSPSKQVTVRLNGQSDAGLVVNAGGLLLFIDGSAAAGASTNATTSNSSGSTAVLEGLAGGT